MIKILFVCHGRSVGWVCNPFIKLGNIEQNEADGNGDTTELTTKEAKLVA